MDEYNNYNHIILKEKLIQKRHFDSLRLVHLFEIEKSPQRITFWETGNIEIAVANQLKAVPVSGFQHYYKK